MTAVPRDPDFWKRFSTAAHLAEDGSMSLNGRPAKSEQDGWLERHRRKSRRSRICICLVTLTFVAFVVVVILAIINLIHHGWYAHGEQFSFP